MARGTRWTQAEVNAHMARQFRGLRPPAEAVERESDLHDQIIDECDRRGWQYLHGAMCKRTARTLGEPDFIILASNGRVIFLECKSRTGKLSPDQAAFKAQASRNSHWIWTVHSMSDVLPIFDLKPN